MPEIVVSSIYKSYGLKKVLKNLTVDFEEGSITGIVGSNGCGKTTLFKIIAGIEYPDSGAVHIRSGARLGYLEQIPQGYEGIDVLTVLKSAFSSLYQLESEMRKLEKLISIDNHNEELLRRYSRVQFEFEHGGGYKIDEKLKRVTLGLNIDEIMQKSMFHELSGGEKTRVLLGRLLLEEPDILLLDEPTNHLDIASIEWLESFLDSYKGTVLIISHDRYFLDRVVDRIVEISRGKSSEYKGNYSNYILTKQKEIEMQQKLYERQEKTIKRLEEAARRMHDWANRSDNPRLHRQAFNIEKRIEKMDKVEKPFTERKLKIRLYNRAFRGKEVITGEKMNFSYDGSKPILKESDFFMTKDERVAIIGANGCGKTTFLKLIMGELSLDSGRLKIGDSASCGYLEQNVVFDMPDRSVLDLVRWELDLPEREARNLLARYNFIGDDVFKQISVLSGGEKSRLRLCLLMASEINLLILDEPTNHLDIASREALENALMDFDGAIIFVSHDRYFINKFASRICELENGKFKDYYGDYEEYRLKKAELMEEYEKKNAEHNGHSKKSPQEDDEYLAQKRARSRARDPWRIKKVESIEEEIEKYENKIKFIEEEMFKCGSDYDKIFELQNKKQELMAKIDGLLEEWEKYSI